MKKTLTTMALVTACILLVITSCQKTPALKALTPNLPPQPYNYTDNTYRMVVTNGGDNTGGILQSDAVTTLGRLLFYDPRLSVNNAISCASCHKQQYAFADNAALSTGYQGAKTQRNTPAIINAVNKSVFFWDGRVGSLELQTLMPVRNHVEMGLEKTNLLPGKLATISYYPDYFQQAFGTPEITTGRISAALASFVRAIVSANSPMDQFNISADAMQGRALFISKFHCATCHRGNNLGGASIFSPYGTTIDSVQTPSQSAQVPNTSNIGLDVSYTDQGEQALTGRANQNGYFVIPSLRNISLTAPYMHDGRFQTLEEVIEHYSTGIQAHPDLDPVLLQSNFDQGFVSTTTGQPVRMNMTATEKRQLIAFLNALTDQTVTTDVRFSDPFK